MARSTAMLAVLVTLAATALLSTVTVWHLSSSTLDPPPGNGWYTRWRSTDPLAYRRQIQLATTTTQQPRARPRAAFDHVYVLSLPAREDRRADMQQLAQALAIDIDFVDAADKDEPFLQWIAERVAESRHLRRQVMVRSPSSFRQLVDSPTQRWATVADHPPTHANAQAEARQVAPESIGGMSIGSDWVTPFPGNLSSHKSGDDEPARFPPYPTTENYGNRNWVSHLESLSASGGRHTSLRPSTSTSSSSLNVTALLWDPLEPLAVRQVHQGVISTYWGQTRAIKRMLENGDEVALILEDDVDVEWDLIDGFWDRIETKLPRRGDEYDWDVTFLGHCWGGEFQSEFATLSYFDGGPDSLTLPPPPPNPCAQNRNTFIRCCTARRARCACTGTPSLRAAPTASSRTCSIRGRPFRPRSTSSSLPSCTSNPNPITCPRSSWRVSASCRR